MEPRAPYRASRWLPVALLPVFLGAAGVAIVAIVSRPADLAAAVLLLVVSAAGAATTLRLRTTQHELEGSRRRTAELLEAARPAPSLLSLAPGLEIGAPQSVEDRPAGTVRTTARPAPERDGAASFASEGRPATDLRILLAEDNLVNQEVALLMLRRLGYRADVASDGREVLEALARQTYDVILMDVQMPAMDGLETTRQVRRSYRGKDRPRIIALTAHADRQHCLAAGMDDYLAKPLYKEALATALCVAADPESGHTIGGPSETESIDRDRLDLLRDLRTRTEQSLLAQIIDLFFESSTEDLATLRRALETGDGRALQDAAHSLLGSSSDLGLTAVSDVCLELKQMPPDCPPELASRTVDRMEHHLRRARKALERVRALS